MTELFGLDKLTSIEISAFVVGSITLIVFCFVFIISQLFLGDIDSSDASDADLDIDNSEGGGFIRFLSFQSILIGISMLCWSFLFFTSLDLGLFSIPLSIITGFASVIGLYLLKAQMRKLNTPNTTPFFSIVPSMIGEAIGNGEPEESFMGHFRDANMQSKDTSVINAGNTRINIGDTIVVTDIKGTNIFVIKYKKN